MLHISNFGCRKCTLRHLVPSTIKGVGVGIYSTVFSRTLDDPTHYPTGDPAYVPGSSGNSMLYQPQDVELSLPLEDHEKTL